MHVPPAPQPDRRILPRWAWILISIPVVIAATLGIQIVANLVQFGRDYRERYQSKGAPEYAANYAIYGLDAFYDDLGRWPSRREGLDALLEKPKGVPDWNGPYSDDFFEDEWGNRIEYQPLSDGYRVTSFGADGEAGGLGVDADLVIERRYVKQQLLVAP